MAETHRQATTPRIVTTRMMVADSYLYDALN